MSDFPTSADELTRQMQINFHSAFLAAAAVKAMAPTGVRKI